MIETISDLNEDQQNKIRKLRELICKYNDYEFQDITINSISSLQNINNEINDITSNESDYEARLLMIRFVMKMRKSFGLTFRQI